MNPSTPVLTDEFADKEVVYAKNQKEYKPLHVIRKSDGVVMSRWKPTEAEREAIASGADILLSVYTFNQPLQPLYMEVPVCDRDYLEIAARMGLLTEESVTD